MAPHRVGKLNEHRPSRGIEPGEQTDKSIWRLSPGTGVEPWVGIVAKTASENRYAGRSIRP